MRKLQKQFRHGFACCGAGCLFLSCFPDLSLGLGVALLLASALLGDYR